MDKKNIFLGSLFAAAALVCLYLSSKYQPSRPNQAGVHEQAAPAPSGAAATTSMQAAPPVITSEFAAVERDHADSAVFTLENSYIAADFTEFGGAIRTVDLKKYPESLQDHRPFVLNELHKDPILAFVGAEGLDRGARYKIVSHSPEEVVFQTILTGGVEVTRRYHISPDQIGKTDPYLIRAETTFTNTGSTPYTAPALLVALGTAAPVSPSDNGLALTTAYAQNGSATFISRRQLEPSSGMFGLMGGHPALPDIVTSGPLQWASVENQFFTSLMTPDQPATALITRRIKLLEKLPDTDSSAYGMTADAQFSLPTIAPHQSLTLGSSIYVGPKEYHRLSNTDIFTQNQDRVMNFGWGFIRYFSALLLTLLDWTHRLGVSWGVAIILTTLFLKIAFLPFTLAASRSAKRMQKIQPQLKAIKEKYKDNPQKQQLATMEIFKEHKVNPVGGCLPILITLPFFWGFFRMLYSAAELRFAPFLWAHDLSQPDTVGVLFGIPINPLPLLLGLTMFLQMQFTPQPTVDSSQARMMKLTPFIFMFFCYSYSCALSLYSTINALFSIAQQMVINRMKDPAATPAAAAVTAGKSLKNVTPRRK